MKNTTHLCTLNVNGMRNKEKGLRIIDWLKRNKCAISFLQETHMDEGLKKNLELESDFIFFCSNGTTASRGVAILINKSLNFEIINEFQDEDGRLILLNIKIEDLIFSLVCLYAPNCRTDRNSFFKKVNNIFKEKTIGIPIVGGDFNETLGPIDRKSENLNARFVEPVASLKEFLKSNNLLDIWRVLNKNTQQFTWRRRDKTQASRIDYILIGNDFQSLIDTCKIKPVVIQYTDHQSVVLTFRVGNSERGKGYWKLNSSVLSDDKYQHLINCLIDKYSERLNDCNIDIRLLWDSLKVEIRDTTIYFCKNKSKQSREITKKLEDELENKIKLRDRLITQDEHLLKNIEELETRLGNIYAEKAKGAQIRSREKWVELGEKNNSYFLGLEKKRQIKKSINKLRHNNEIITEQNEILNIIKDYYEELYTSSNPDKDLLVEYIFNTVKERDVDRNDFGICDGEITVEECTTAINMMKLNKSPGLDGITLEFYKTFWQKLGPILVKVLNKGHEEKLLSYSQRTSVLSLLFKKNDPTSLDNYRPISLLNVDLKILSYVLAQRLKPLLPKLISEDQTGYIKNRFIGFNLRQIQDIIDYTELHGLEGAIIFVDFTKAFDSLEWDFMFNVLKYFGFNDSFISWVETLYSEIQTCVTNNGWISKVFKNKRGIRQGCPLSALLFVLSVEIMALRLRDNKEINGIQINLENIAHKIKISQLADDTTLFCSSKDDASNAMNEIEIFGSFSGLKLNRNKTEGLWVGKLKHSKDKILDINWTDKPVKALGVYFGHNKSECEKLNWETKIEKMKKLIKAWEKRNLTMIGKILIIKSLILPIFTFCATSNVIPCKYIKEIERSCFRYIWDGKNDKVKRSTLIGRYEKGGLNMIDFESYFKALKASWVSKLVTPGLANWKIIPLKFFSHLGGKFLIFNVNLDNEKSMPCLENLSEFYREVITCWVTSGGGNTKYPKHFSDVRKQIIWGNKFIKFGNKCLFFKNWVKSGLIFINDIIDKKGNLTETFILEKLENKCNWISEFHILKMSIPKEWFSILSKENSIYSKVNICTTKIRWRNNLLNAEELNNKMFYNVLVQDKQTAPIGINVWTRFLELEQNPSMDKVYRFIFYTLQENKLKVFRWKLLQFIIPTKTLLLKWKISTDGKCNFCKSDEENYIHFFLSCKFLNEFWGKINNLFKNVKFEVNISLKHLVFGYKIFDDNYSSFNYLLTILSFSIYKSYYVSEQKTKHVNVFSIFIQEFRRIMHENKRMRKDVFFNNVRKYIDRNVEL